MEKASLLSFAIALGQFAVSNFVELNMLLGSALCQKPFSTDTRPRDTDLNNMPKMELFLWEFALSLIIKLKVLRLRFIMQLKYP
jgi:hypothetical protein